jgi:hypothetical protein
MQKYTVGEVRGKSAAVASSSDSSQIRGRDEKYTKNLVTKN